MLKPFRSIRAGGSPARQGLTGPPETECCVASERSGRRSVHREHVGCVIEPRKLMVGRADAVSDAEGHMGGLQWSGPNISPGS